MTGGESSRRGGGGVTRVYKWELLKLLAQKRTYLGLGTAMLVPTRVRRRAARSQTGGPNDIPLGRYIRADRARDAVRRPLLHVDLGVPADHGARRGRHRRGGEPERDAEDDPHALAQPRRDLRGQGARHRSRTRARDPVAMGVVALVAAGIAWGFDAADVALRARPSLPGTGSACSRRASASTCWPMAGIAAFGMLLSTITRNSAAAVVGTLMWALLMQLLGVLPGTEPIRPYLLGTQFDAWHGFLRTPADWAPVVRALWVCALYVASRSPPATSSSCAATSPASSLAVGRSGARGRRSPPRRPPRRAPRRRPASGRRRRRARAGPRPRPRATSSRSGPASVPSRSIAVTSTRAPGGALERLGEREPGASVQPAARTSPSRTSSASTSASPSSSHGVGSGHAAVPTTTRSAPASSSARASARRADPARGLQRRGRERSRDRRGRARAARRPSARRRGRRGGCAARPRATQRAASVDRVVGALDDRRRSRPGAGARPRRRARRRPGSPRSRCSNHMFTC